MKKIVMTFAAVLLLVGLVGQAAQSAPKKTRKADAGWSAGSAGPGVVLNTTTSRGRRAAAAARAAGVSAATSGASARGDFDDDNRQDLAVGAPGEVGGAGVVHIIYGTATGLASAGNQLIRQEDAICCSSEAGDGFGSSLAAGDFDGDGFTDLAVGVPGEDVGVNAQGSVIVFFGSGAGITGTGSQWLNQGGTIQDTPEDSDAFGFSLAAGNFGNGTQADLAIGVPSEDLSATTDGAVQVLYGSGTGLSDTNDQLWSQDSTFIEGVAEDNDNFGFALAAANFGRSGQADLAIGAPGETVGDAIAAGAVTVLFGTTDGLNVFSDQVWTQDSEGILDSSEEIDEFGLTLAAANFGKSSHADLAIGAPLESLPPQAELTGAVNVLYGGSGGLTAAGDQFWHQNVAGIADTAEIQDLFGLALGAANFGKSGQSDLAVGVPGETIGASLFGAGAVNVFYGTTSGLNATGDQFWHQNSTGVLEAAEVGDGFGNALVAANYGKTSHADLAIGVPDETIGGVDGGAVNVLYGTTAGLSEAGDQLWHQNSSGIADSVESGDSFGEAL